MTDIDITCTPPAGILTISAATVQRLDRLAATLPAGDPWHIEVRIRDITLTATPARQETP